MFAQHAAGVVGIANVGFPAWLDIGGLLINLQRHQLHKSADHFRGTQYPQFLEFIFGLAQILVVIEVRPHRRVLGKESKDLQTLAVKSLVHVTPGLLQHHFDLALGGFQSEYAADYCAENAAD
jgi:hypothetical protein